MVISVLRLRLVNGSVFFIATNIQGTKDLAGVVIDIIADGKPVDIILISSVIIYDKAGNPWQAMELFRKILFFWKAELGVV